MVQTNAKKPTEQNETKLMDSECPVGIRGLRKEIQTIYLLNRGAFQSSLKYTNSNMKSGLVAPEQRYTLSFITMIS